jgi:DNA invertase Pin-like site-specific DNA recombinase
MKIGYARISTTDQNIERQLEKLKEQGVEDRFIYVDKQSGKDFDREQYQLMKKTLREGDILYLDALDRLGRDYNGIIREWKEITGEIHCDIVCLDNPELFNSKKYREMGDMGKLLQDQILSLLAYVADTERKKLLQRQRAGIEIAKREGKYKGRKPKKLANWDEVYRKWINDEITAVEACRTLGISRSGFYHRVGKNLSF